MAWNLPSAASVLAILLAATTAAGESDLILRSNTRLVQITVIAKDKNGQSLVGLKRDDFKLLDNGKKREIRVFHFDQAAAESSEAAPISGNRIFTNQHETSNMSGVINIIVIDSLNTNWPDQSSAAKAIIEFLKTLHSEDRIAIYSLAYGGFQILHDFTRDASDIVESLKNWNGKLPDPRLDHGRANPGAALAQVLNGQDSMHRNAQLNEAAGGDGWLQAPAGSHATERTLAAFASIAAHLAGIPGRKNLIWVSDGMPATEWSNLAITAAPGRSYSPPTVATYNNYQFPGSSDGHARDSVGDSQSFANLAASTTKLINRANIAIYPIEARGLSPGYSPHDGLSEDATEQYMLAIAAQTGGRAFVRRNDLAGSLRAAAEDATAVYTLGFYLDSAQPDGKYHELRVELPGKHGVQLRYQKGYLQDAQSTSAPQLRKAALDDALLSPMDATGVPLTVELARTGNDRYQLKLRIAAGTFALPLAANGRIGSFDIVLVQRSSQGEEISRVNDTMQMALRESTYRQFQKDGVPYQREIQMDAKMSAIRIVVRDSATGNLGSLTISRNEAL